jgi:hypothetical protein
MTMNKLGSVALVVVLFAAIASGCAAATQVPAGEVINPGDKIGDFLIKTGDEADLANSFDQKCNKPGDEGKYLCEMMVGKNLNVSLGIYDDHYSGKLEEIWAKHTYEMTINDHPVNLIAFGSIDRQHPTAGLMRHWNVVIVTDKPGEITVHSKCVVGSKPFDDITTYNFIFP